MRNVIKLSFLSMTHSTFDDFEYFIQRRSIKSFCTTQRLSSAPCGLDGSSLLMRFLHEIDYLHCVNWTPVEIRTPKVRTTTGVLT